MPDVAKHPAFVVGAGTMHGEGCRGHRPRVLGKFIYIGDVKLYLRGVTYGTFRPDDEGNDYADPCTVERDFAQMRASGVNAVRTYTVPPRWLLDRAQAHGLYVLVGLPWEQHIAFLDAPGRADDIEARVRQGVRSCAGHPAVLAYTIGNEIPASIVRWHGARSVERFLQRLYLAVKDEDPGALVTYVNFPTTEYLDLSFVDFLTFNVYLESQAKLEAYLARLQNLAGSRPLVMAEIGFDSRRNGEQAQAHVLEWQVRTAFAAGCAGAFVFAWTDEWYRGGFDIDDWDFGLTRRDRSPKPALSAVREVFARLPIALDACPRISVVVCTYNGARTLSETLSRLSALDYPDYEVIVVDDGSTDDSAEIACRFDVRLISTPNRGLSSARNTGLWAATGEIVAYLDDDAYPDADWLRYLAAAFQQSGHAGIGGPNLAPEDDGLIAECVASAPGGPTHVLLTDQIAEHIPGCNMAFRRRALLAIGGFDPQFRAAGDDVDICWRLQERGWTIGFSPAAVVWHHRRNAIRAYWKQQFGYGRAEAMLAAKWPEKYNALGHLSWAGRIYGHGLTAALLAPGGRIYGGTWGSALFQSIYQPAPGMLASLPLMPEWYLLSLTLGALALLGLFWSPLLLALPLFLVTLGLPVAQGLLSARRVLSLRPHDVPQRRGLFSVTALLFLLQPLARLRGRLREGLTPWRRPQGRRDRPLSLPRACSLTFWSETWRSAEERLTLLEAALAQSSGTVTRGGDFDRWDLQVRGGLAGAVRMRLAIEEHGAGKQLLRLRFWPRLSVYAVCAVLLLGALAISAALDGAAVCAIGLALASLGISLQLAYDCAVATAIVESEAAATIEAPNAKAGRRPGGLAVDPALSANHGGGEGD